MLRSVSLSSLVLGINIAGSASCPSPHTFPPLMLQPCCGTGGGRAACCEKLSRMLRSHLPSTQLPECNCPPAISVMQVMAPCQCMVLADSLVVLPTRCQAWTCHVRVCQRRKLSRHIAAAYGEPQAKAERRYWPRNSQRRAVLLSTLYLLHSVPTFAQPRLDGLQANLPAGVSWIISADNKRLDASCCSNQHRQAHHKLLLRRLCTNSLEACWGSSYFHRG